jgi:hypothetical protein
MREGFHSLIRLIPPYVFGYPDPLADEMLAEANIEVERFTP